MWFYLSKNAIHVAVISFIVAFIGFWLTQKMKFLVKEIMEKALYFIFSLSIISTLVYGNEIENSGSIVNTHSIQLTKTTLTPKIDGILNDEVWKGIEPITNFLQREPKEGIPSTEKTEVKITFDENFLYFAIRCYDSEPQKIIKKELRRDGPLGQDDHIGIAIDTYHDHRNGYFFATNAQGVKKDAQFFNEYEKINFDWDGVWYSKGRTDDKGWTAEIAIPFYTLRFEKSENITMGIIISRTIRRKNEHVFWPLVPREFGKGGMFYISRGAHMHGLHGIKRGRHIEVKPFAISGFGQDFINSNGKMDLLRDIGVDIKYGLTPSLTVDFTLNSDFAQVEADDEQVNLTRFDLFFPEKREFFIEGSGIFDFGISKEAQVFFSRKIGISNGKEVPILGGARLTGKVGRFKLGLLNIYARETDLIPSNNFIVVRARRDIFARSNIGFIFTNRQSSLGKDYNRVFGVDANFTFWKNINLHSFIAKSETPGLSDEEFAGLVRFFGESDKWFFDLSYTDIGKNFNPEVGFLRRSDIKRKKGVFFWSPRPNSKLIKKYRFWAGASSLENHENIPQSRDYCGKFEIIFESGELFSISYSNLFERLNEDFEIMTDFIIPIGTYEFDFISLLLKTERSRKISGNILFQKGDFFNGSKTTYDLGGQFRLSNHLSISMNYEHNSVDLPQGPFSTNILKAKINYAFNPQLFANALIQYNDVEKELNINLRLNFIHTPGSDLFIVLNESRNTDKFGPQINTRALVIKLTYLFNF